jgi:hypothetical protein
MQSHLGDERSSAAGCGLDRTEQRFAVRTLLVDIRLTT